MRVFASLALLAASIMPVQASVQTDEFEIKRIVHEPVILDVGQLKRHCLALALYFEGGSTFESEVGLRHIADTVEERAKANLRKWGGRDICEVVFYKVKGVCQFTFACLPLRKRTPRLGAVWSRMLEIADEALASKEPLENGLVRYYQNPDQTSCTMRRAFKREYVLLGQAGRHLFFREPSEEERRELAKAQLPECKKAKAKAKKLARDKGSKRYSNHKKGGKKYAHK